MGFASCSNVKLAYRDSGQYVHWRRLIQMNIQELSTCLCITWGQSCITEQPFLRHGASMARHDVQRRHSSSYGVST